MAKNEDLKETVQIPDEFFTRLNEIKKQYETIINGLNSKIDHLERNDTLEKNCLEIVEDVLDFLFLIVSTNKQNKG